MRLLVRYGQSEGVTNILPDKSPLMTNPHPVRMISVYLLPLEPGINA